MGEIFPVTSTSPDNSAISSSRISDNLVGVGSDPKRRTLSEVTNSVLVVVVVMVVVVVVVVLVVIAVVRVVVVVVVVVVVLVDVDDVSDRSGKVDKVDATVGFCSGLAVA